MARARVSEVIELSSTKASIAGAHVAIRHDDGTPASAFAAPTGGSPLPQPLVADNSGAIDVWLDEGFYLFDVSPTVSSTQFVPQTVRIQASLTGSTVESQSLYVVGVLYTGNPPPRPDVGGAFVIWNGPVDPGSEAIDGDLGIGWTP